MLANSYSAEVVETALNEAGALGLERRDGELPEGQRLFSHDQIEVVAYFDEAQGLRELIKKSLHKFLLATGLPALEIHFEEFLEEDWQGNFVRSLKTLRLEPGIFVVPSHELPDFLKEHSHELHIVMDPENAFGTGQHQTTQLCMTSLARYVSALPLATRAGMKALDIGTGSGILAILLKKYQVGLVTASENDDTAVVTAKKNAITNGVDIELMLVGDGHSYGVAQYDLVVANILAPVLIDMADVIVAACKKTGRIFLSGILKSQSQAVIARYEALSAQLVQCLAIDDWVVLEFLV